MPAPNTNIQLILEKIENMSLRMNTVELRIGKVEDRLDAKYEELRRDVGTIKDELYLAITKLRETLYNILFLSMLIPALFFIVAIIANHFWK